MARDPTVEILKSIRDEIRETNTRVETMREELSRRIVESEVRTSTALAEVAWTLREMTTLLRQGNELRPRLERCEQEIETLKRKVG